MQVELTQSYCTLRREPGDPRVSRESTVGYHMRRLLNAEGWHFTRINPSRHGLTSCAVGMLDRRADVVLWHERYAVEDAAKEFNRGSVTFKRVNATCA